MSRLKHFCAAAVAAALSTIAASAPALAQAQSDIVVTGLTREQASTFVSQLAAVPPSADQLGRWDSAICIGVAGLPARQGQFIADRVAQRAFAVGLEPGAAGCAPNVSIVIAPDGDAVARQMSESDPSLFALRYETGVSTLGSEAFSQFLNSSRPVRWWHVTRTLSADGESLGSESASSSATGGFQGAQTVRSTGSRLRTATRQDFGRVVVIVDARSAGSVQLVALADYIAMVALAQIDPSADTSAFPTILNAFSGEGAPTTMTSWDTGYLSALYTVARDAPSVTAQETEIARRMYDERS